MEGNVRSLLAGTIPTFTDNSLFDLLTYAYIIKDIYKKIVYLLKIL
jgi:hypothetical protein